MSTPTRAPIARNLAGNPVLVGTAMLAVALVGIVLSYNSNKGLPFVPTYQITVDVPDAAELVEAASEVRIGGARVGTVQEIEAIKGEGGEPALARLSLAMQRDQRIPVDSRVKVRPRSILGAKYVEIRRGKSTQTVLPGGALPLENSEPLVELDEAFNTFDKETTEGIRGVVNNLGNGLAGRGTALNQLIAETRPLMPPLQRVLGAVIDDRADLRGFLRGSVRAFRALEPVAPDLLSLFDHGAITLAALDDAGDSLGQSIAELPATEAVGTRALTRITPVLADAAELARGLRAGAEELPRATNRLASALEASTPVLRRGPLLAEPLKDTLTALDTLARDPAAPRAVTKLISLVASLKPVADTVVPAQLQCNILGLYYRNNSDTISDGDAAGTWLSFTPIVNQGQMQQTAAPSSDLHVNYYPNENTAECEAGNEPYAPGQAIGNPPGNQRNTTELTSQPQPARSRSRASREPSLGQRLERLLAALAEVAR